MKKRNFIIKIIITFIFIIFFINTLTCISKASSIINNNNFDKTSDDICNHYPSKEVENAFNTISSFIYTLSLLIPIIFIFSTFNFIKSKLNLKKENLDNNNQKSKNKKNIFKYIISLIICFVLFVLTQFWRIISNFAKPLIYLYPEKKENISIKLGKKENLTCTYPKYTDSWEVIAFPNGELIDKKTNRNLYGLYWEGKGKINTKHDSGFCVEGSKTIDFLEEKLEILGLTEREANEFIIYWLPHLEKNKYNFIRFQTIDEINEIMPLEVSPAPDTIIRIMMEYKPLKKYIKIKEQELSTPIRKGFVLVEWGGTKINKI